jgi:CBS domain-containing protein
MTTVTALLHDKSAQTVRTLPPDASVLEAIRLMAEHHIGSVLVTEAGRPVGIVTERDYARKVILMGRSSADTRLSDVMSSPVLSVASSDSIEHCMQMMTDHRIRHLPVLDGGSLAGMVSIGDLLKALLELRQREIEQLQQYITG